jgi:hypothetical protein
MRIQKMSGLALPIALASCLLGTPSAALAASPPEAPVTEAASAVTGTTATLNGTLNPKAKAQAGWYFAYNAGGACTGGATTPVEPEAEVKAQKELAHLTGLAPSTTYAACLVATVESEEGQLATVGTQVTFKTARSAPVIDGESVATVTPFEATVEALVNPEREDTSCNVEYGTTKAYGSVAPCEPVDLGGGFGDQSAVAHLTGLEAGQGYFYRVVAENATGARKGTGGEFTTLPAEAPTVESESLIQLTPDEAIVEAQLDPHSQETSYHFEYATNSAFNEAVATGQAALSAVTGGQPTGPVVLANDLASGTTYFYRVVAENATGITDGETQAFRTIGLPDAQTGEAQGAGRTTAALSGMLDPEGGETSYRFLYIDQAGYETAVAHALANPYASGGKTAAFTLPAGSEPVPVGPVPVGELVAGTTYHYALTATNEAGTTIGPDRTLTTAPGTPPNVVTGSASQVTQSSAELEGSIDTQGLQTAYQFEIGTEVGHYTPQAPNVIGAGSTGTEVLTAQSQYLSSNTSYHYRLCATNQDGTRCGADGTFVTPAYPSLVPAEAVPYPLLTSVRPQGQPLPAGSSQRTPTRAEKLAKALRACRAKPRSRRVRCERKARRSFGPPSHKKTKK